MKRLIFAFIRGDEGQDLIEYALLTAFIGLSSVVAYNLISLAIAATYASWDGTTQRLADAPDPL